ncbi:MAG: precorrin-6A reductase [Synergistaceae bacterium]|jgi:precorrin-2 dehydrogenase/sirohydrochlorin ferrochelatase/precorrin-6A/cobalt-precorrin-6A reductase|nr:precorrin-6A reductase [Synergistaceae bacterium]
MKKILLLGGTTEGRKILDSGLPLIYSVATEYGAEVAGFCEVHVGRMDAGEMELFILQNDVAGVIDATHPHAREVSKNARSACERTLTPYARAMRESVTIDEKKILTVASCGEAAELLNEPRRRDAGALLTVGSRELACFTSVVDYRKRLFVRVLPTGEAILSCEKMGFDAGHVIAMQGPFSRAMNRATLEMTSVRVLVTKDSGVAGGLGEKLEAARDCGVDVVLVRRPKETGMTVAEAVEWGRSLLHNARSGTLSVSIREGRIREDRETCPYARSFPFFPLFMNIAGRSVLVVGGGAVALRRVRTLLTCGADVTAISPEFHASFAGLSDEVRGNGPPPKLKLIEARCETCRFENIFMAVLATNDRELNRRLGEEARRAGVHVSVADAPEECTFYFPALIAEGEVVAAVSTGGRSPGLNRRLSDRLRGVWRDWVKEEKT